jgi:hypothetical protein
LVETEQPSPGPLIGEHEGMVGLDLEGHERRQAVDPRRFARGTRSPREFSGNRTSGLSFAG